MNYDELLQVCQELEGRNYPCIEIGNVIRDIFSILKENASYNLIKLLLSASLVRDVGLKRDAEDLYEILRVVAIPTDQLQLARCKIADVVCIMKNLEKLWSLCS